MISGPNTFSVEFQTGAADDYCGVVFDGYGTNASPVEVVDCHLQGALDHLARIVSMRYAAAVSGAMRWPWSQEYIITTSLLTHDNGRDR